MVLQIASHSQRKESNLESSSTYWRCVSKSSPWQKSEPPRRSLLLKHERNDESSQWFRFIKGSLCLQRLSSLQRETFEECACREVEEETGLLIQNVRLGTVTNTVLLDDLRPAHYVTVYVKADLIDPEAHPQTLEPDKCDGWQWIEWPNIPDPIFKPLEELISMNYDPFL